MFLYRRSHELAEELFGLWNSLIQLEALRLYGLATEEHFIEGNLQPEELAEAQQSYRHANRDEFVFDADSAVGVSELHVCWLDYEVLGQGLLWL